ncbi:hypothetical protein AMEX_G7198 [Astyanax mexicanus]|uniref:Ig-like domain-containing protein n=1 Tax=Astyanax mexicanus TaxID=7994 RepID=A0A8T2M697_ASTMX|nr:hypothetical protein AMEX_G7198 [Astyanax mexicanus]
MSLSNAAAVLFFIVLNCVHIESQDSLPLPTLSLDPSMNTSDIQLLSQVKLLCSIPDKAPFPVLVYIAHADNPVVNSARWPIFSNLRSADVIIFTILLNPEAEGTFVCRYQSTRSKQDSGLSNSVNLVINSLPKPIMSLRPSLILLGGRYVAVCTTPADGFVNVTMRLYERPLPLTPGKEGFNFVGSRTLAPTEIGASVNKTIAVVSTEHVCTMEVFYKGKILQSASIPVVAIPDELPARLYSPVRDSAACSGYLSMRVKDVWRPVCFPRSSDYQLEAADVVCREVNCGHALGWDTLSDGSSNILGTPQCTGKEKKIAECPIANVNCYNPSFHVICSGAMPPPKFSAIGHGSASVVYLRSEESVTLSCSLESSSLTSSDWIYLKITLNGKRMDSRHFISTDSFRYTFTPKVMEGEYSCFASPDSGFLRQSEKSNSVYVYIYDPPPAGAVAAAVITTVAGAALLIFVCVFRKSQEELQSNAHAAATPNPEVTQPGNTTIPPQGTLPQV